MEEFMKEILVAALCLGTLAACGGGGGGGDMTEDPTPTGDGDTGGGDTGGEDTDGGSTGGGTGGGGLQAPTLNAQLLGTNAAFPTNTLRIDIEDGRTPDGSNGYDIQVGVLSDNSSVIANARVSLGSFFPTPDPATGSATLISTYDAIVLRNPTTDVGQVEVETVRANDAPITLTADFTGTGTGTLTGTDGALEIDGTFSETIRSLNGTATFEGIEGTLRGFVGGAEAFGAFAGQNSTGVLAGGFASN